MAGLLAMLMAASPLFAQAPPQQPSAQPSALGGLVQLSVLNPRLSIPQGSSRLRVCCYYTSSYGQ